MTFRTLGINLQLILVIVTTAITISVVDNILDIQRLEEDIENREGVADELQIAQQRHHNITIETAENNHEVLQFLINSTTKRDAELAPIFEQFQEHIDLTHENNELLKELLLLLSTNRTSSSDSNSSSS